MFNSKMFKNINTNCQIEVKNEYDLHCRVVKFLRKRYPDVILIVGLGELQDTSSKRISAYNKGYKGGQPDLILVHAIKLYNGMAIEFKNPNGTGRLSPKQKMLNYPNKKSVLSTQAETVLSTQTQKEC
jgi:hypothetical protein